MNTTSAKIVRMALIVMLLAAFGMPANAAQTAAARPQPAAPEPPAAPEGWLASAVAGGYRHVCALTAGGAVKCWGNNEYGQLGDGTTTDRWTPVDVVGLGSGVSAISAWSRHTCALTTGGAVKCWGNNLAGQLGDGTTTNRLTPVDVVGLNSGVLAIVIGSNHTCALAAGNAVKCWGINGAGQLGDGTTTNRLTPVDVVGLGGEVSSIAAAGNHTCAILTGGAVKCWGWNNYGQLGDGTTTDRWTPVGVAGLGSGVSNLNAGYGYTCAVAAGGAAKCWGRNEFGQIGDGTTTDRLTPVDVTGLGSGVSAISADGSHTCALLAGGTARCWGYNFFGQLGDGTTTDRLTPVDVVGLDSEVLAISVGGSHTCALLAGEVVKCWGLNDHGQLGDGTGVSSPLPRKVIGAGFALDLFLPMLLK